MIFDLAALGLTAEQVAGVVSVLETEGDARRSKARDKKRRRRRDMPESAWLRLRRVVFARDGKVCRYCASTDGPFHIDHVIPLSRGGTHDLGNLAVACHGCNSAKSGKLLSEWAR